MKYITEPLSAAHERSLFNSGYESLDYYIQKQATQDMKRKLSVVFVAANDEGRVKGYYTLSSDNVDKEDIPTSLSKKMPPSYDVYPTILLGRLACDKEFQGQRLGEALLFDALCRTLDASESLIGSMAVVVDPIDDKAQSFYNKYGFINLNDRNRMFLPMKTIKQMFT